MPLSDCLLFRDYGLNEIVNRTGYSKGYVTKVMYEYADLSPAFMRKCCYVFKRQVYNLFSIEGEYVPDDIAEQLHVNFEEIDPNDEKEFNSVYELAQIFRQLCRRWEGRIERLREDGEFEKAAEFQTKFEELNRIYRKNRDKTDNVKPVSQKTLMILGGGIIDA